ncbi:hypothetical protein OH492_12630 [Vibrio chagasii]|nr:hypothetical protein [Vibrio chagasii]
MKEPRDALAALDTRYETYYNRYLSQFTQLNSLSSQLDSVSGLFTIENYSCFWETAASQLCQCSSDGECFSVVEL